MQRPRFPYLDLCVWNPLRKYMLSLEPAVLFNATINETLWSNAAGALFFGGTGVADLLSAAPSPSQPIIKQITAAAGQIDGSEPLERSFRIVQGLRSKLVQCRLSTVELPDGSSGVFLVCENPEARHLRNDAEAAKMAVRSLEDFADAAAILDDDGLIVAASSDFSDIEVAYEDLEILINELQGESDRLVKRPIITLDEKTYGTGIAMLQRRPGRNLFVLVAADEELQAPTDASHVDETSVQEETDEAPNADVAPEVGGTSDPDGKSVSDRAKSLLDRWHQSETGGSVEQGTVNPFGRDQKDDIDTTEEPTEEETTAIAGESDQDVQPQVQETAELSRVDQESEKKPEELSVTKPADSDFRFTEKSDPTRFAWSTNEDKIFKSVSLELAETVGPNAADVEERSWRDVAIVFGFDLNGEVEELLSKQDTWSGRTVLWPVQGTDLAVPIDLAALPVFTAGRQFEGFRGFGIIRTADAVTDPIATGMALEDYRSSGGETTQKTQRDIPFSENDEPEGLGLLDSLAENTHTGNSAIEAKTEDVAGRNAPKSIGQLGSNIVNIFPRSKSLEEADTFSSLNEREAQAFDKIGEKLRDQLKPAKEKFETDPLFEDGDTDTENLGIAGDHEPVEAVDEPEYISEPQDEIEKPDELPSETYTAVLDRLASPVLVYMNGVTFYANQELLELTGYTSIDELSRAGGVDAILDGSSNDQIGKGRKTVLLGRDGNEIKVNAHLQRVPWDGGKALMLTFDTNALPILSDTPSMDAVELDEVRLVELQNILDTATDGVIIMTADGTIESVNAPASALFGLEPENAADKPLQSLFAIESQSVVEDYLKAQNNLSGSELINDGRQVIGREAKGGLIPLYMTLGKTGNGSKLCAVLRDLTDWKKVEEELVSAKHRAETASEQKSEFLAQVSHEIRTPLNAIIGFSDVMIEERFGPVENERYREYLRDINLSGTHVLDLINDLLDLSKIEAGKIDLSFEAVDLNKIVSESVALMQPQANSDRILIRTSLSRAVPKVVADVRSMRQIVMNLVSNAIKFTPANGQVIVSTVFESNGEVALRIRDTGIGMNNDQLEEAMKPFQQVSGLSDKQVRGTGLGLPLTKALVEANRAHFDLESEPQNGTIAHIQFPVQRVLAD